MKSLWVSSELWLTAHPLPMLLIQERKMELNWNLTRSVWFLNEIENPPQKNMTHRPPVDNNANMRRIANTAKVKSVWFSNKTDQQSQNVQNDSWSTPCQCCRYQKDCQHSRVTVRVTPAHSSPVICKFYLISNTSLQYSICRTNFKYCGRFASNMDCFRKRKKAKFIQSNFFILFSNTNNRNMENRFIISKEKPTQTVKKNFSKFQKTEDSKVDSNSSLYCIVVF